jgi:hypothetical protein
MGGRWVALRRFGRISAFVACASLLLPPSGAGAAARVIARDTALGDSALALVEVDLGRPNTLYIKVESQPEARVRASWKLSCTEEDGRSGWQRGHRTDLAPFRWRIRNPFGAGAICTIRAKARLRGEGDWVRLILLETRR